MTEARGIQTGQTVTVEYSSSPDVRDGETGVVGRMAHGRAEITFPCGKVRWLVAMSLRGES